MDSLGHMGLQKMKGGGGGGGEDGFWFSRIVEVAREALSHWSGKSLTVWGRADWAMNVVRGGCSRQEYWSGLPPPHTLAPPPPAIPISAGSGEDSQSNHPSPWSMGGIVN